MSAAGTADGYNELALALLAVKRDKIIKQVAELRFESPRLVPLENIVPDGRFKPRVLLQLLNIERIRQAAHVEHQIGIVRNAVFEAERHAVNLERVARIVEKHFADSVLAVGRGHMRAVDNIIRYALCGLENTALRSQGIVYGAVIFIEQRVLAPCLLISADKHIIRGIDKQQLRVALELLELDYGVEQIAE